ncbi:MAG: tetratricopeptide repeat protein [Phaeodactylibacter sp.]|nr:tetratricopeptide repeat protein [Phaeodactylibacter sp.]MCB9051173.1 tetratricopeptide repeat protein [Lewinellaceae bacterium]
MRKLLLIIFLLSGWVAGRAQELTFRSESIRTYAVVIGISEYQDNSIQDLGYAHKDAKEFADFLRSRAGGELSRRELKVLINEEATLARIQSELKWLAKKAGDGDQAIIYFAGHGDVETKNDEEKGYLLAYDTPYNNYRLNALGLDYLNEQVVGELSQKGAKVVIITDACHSGALAGSNVNGRQATAAELMKRFSNEVRIMSCQPYELSLEKRALGGGRGVFSYYLIQGLKGRANQGRKDVVDLYELENFLQEKVRKETDKSQHPDIFGGLKKEALFLIDEATLEELKSIEKAELERSLEEEVLSKLATREGYVNYEGFKDALEKGRLASPAGRSALDYYDALYADTAFIPLRSIIDERLTIALMDSVQQAINAYLKTDPEELSQRERFDQKYTRFPVYLQRVAEILGSRDPRYQETLAKQYYFEGLVLRLEAEGQSDRDSLYRLALEKQEKALEMEGRAAYIHNELGVLLPELGEFEKGIAHLQKAIEISPTWAIPYNNLAVDYKRQGNLEEAKAHYLKAIAFKPDFSSAYSNLGNLFVAQEEYDSAELMYRKGIELGPTYKDNYLNLGLLLSGYEGKEAEAENLYREAIRLSPDYPEAWFELANLYDAQELADSAEAYYLKAISLRPAYLEARQNLGIFYYFQGRQEEAEGQFHEAIRLDAGYLPVYVNLGFLYVEQGEWEKAVQLVQEAPLDTSAQVQIWHEIGFAAFQSERYDEARNAFNMAVEAGPANPWNSYMLCTFHVLLGQESEALIQLEKALEKARRAGEDYYEQVSTDEDLAPLRLTEGYKELMERFFPGRQD